MGCTQASQAPRDPTPMAHSSAGISAHGLTFDHVDPLGRKLNKEDFIVKNRNGETITRKPGSIFNQQFIIENCNDCDIFLLDNIATITIDDCKNCRIFAGPTETSIFVRDCADCNVVSVCGQFRLRDCTNVGVNLFCGTRPVIETSKNLTFSCFDYSYPGLKEQMNEAGLVPYNNIWYSIYDFSKGGENTEVFAPDNVSSATLLKPLPDDVGLKADAPWVVPRTRGVRKDTAKEECVFVAMSLKTAEAGTGRALVDAINAHETAHVVRTATFEFTPSIMTDVLKMSAADSATRQLLNQSWCGAGTKVLGLEIRGKGVQDVVTATMGEGNRSDSDVYVSSNDKEATYQAKVFFHQFQTTDVGSDIKSGGGMR